MSDYQNQKAPGSTCMKSRLSNLKSRFANPFLAGLIALGALLPPPAVFPNSSRLSHTHDDAHLLEVGGTLKAISSVAAPAELKMVSYNIRWRGGEDLEELIELLRRDPEIGGASLIGLQEVDRNKKRTARINTARIMAEALGMTYVWAAPPNPRPKPGQVTKTTEEEETGVAILSMYPLSDVERLVLAHEGPNRRRRVAIGATARIGDVNVRFYCLHSETRTTLEKKLEQWGAVLANLERYPKIQHVVVLGDFNTIKERDVRAARGLFTRAGFVTPFSDDDATFKVLLFDFKLDWIWLRGFASQEYGIDKKIGLSDHWPLWVKVRFETKGSPAVTSLPPPIKR